MFSPQSGTTKSQRPRPEDIIRFSVCLLMIVASGVGVSGGDAVPVAVNRGRDVAEMNDVRQPPSAVTYAIVGARLVDGNGGTPVESATIVTRGSTILAVGPSDEVDVPDDAIILNAAGMTVLPGLFDAHFHSRDSVEQPVQYLLLNGVTSFRDPGHPFKYYDVLLRSDAVIPRVFLCGGHLDGPPAVWPDQAMVIQSADEAIEAVNRHVERGASAIKVYFRLPLPFVKAACDAAAQHHVPVTAHLELVDADDAIDAGVRGIEHITSFGTALSEDADAMHFKELVTADSDARREWRYRMWERLEIEDNPRVPRLIQHVISNDVFVSPTLAVFERQTGEKGGTEVQAAAFANMCRFFGECHKAGAKTVVGSHTHVPFAPRTRAYLREMELMVECGMTPLEVITSATKTGAEFFGVADRLGTVEVGKVADLLIVRGRPDRNIRDIDNVNRVMLNGAWVDISDRD